MVLPDQASTVSVYLSAFCEKRKAKKSLSNKIIPGGGSRGRELLKREASHQSKVEVVLPQHSSRPSGEGEAGKQGV
jgi:hypothetical protein